MGQMRRVDLARLAVLAVAMLALWAAGTGILARRDSAPSREDRGPADPTAEAPALGAHPGRVRDPAEQRAGESAPDEPAWSVGPAPPPAPALRVIVPCSASGRDAVTCDLTASSSQEERSVVLVRFESGAFYLFDAGPSSSYPRLAYSSEPVEILADGSAAFRTTLTGGRWLLVASDSEDKGRSSGVPLAWGWADVGPDSGPLRLQPVDPSRSGRLRIRARATAQEGSAVAAVVRWRGCKWAWIWGVPPPGDDAAAADVEVPAEEDLTVDLSGAAGWPSHHRALRRTVRVAPRGLETVDFDLPTPVPVRIVARPLGRTTDPVKVQVWAAESGKPRVHMGTPRRTGTDTYEIGLPPGTYIAFAAGPALAGAAREAFVVEPPGPITLDLPLREAGSTLRLRVREADGSPARGLWLSVGGLRTSDPSRALMADVTTDGDGMAEIGPVPPGPLDVFVDRESWIFSVESAGGPEAPVELRLPPPGRSAEGSLRLHVRQSDDQPWPEGPAVLARAGSSSGRYANRDWWSQAYVFRDVAPGEWVLTLPATWDSPLRTETIRIPLRVSPDAPRELVVRPLGR